MADYNGLYEYGGIDTFGSGDNGKEVAISPLGLIGRWINNASGTTANNMYNAQQAAIARQFEADEAVKARNFEHDEADIARRFEERMSSTAYQRAAADMRAAGINPATLAGLASGGSPASTPSGNKASSAKASGHAASSSGSSGKGIIGTAIKAILMLAAFA